MRPSDPEHRHENRPGVSGEILRACDSYEKQARAELDAQVRRPGELRCATCRRPTALTDLTGAPGRWICTTCAASAATTQSAPHAPTQEEEEEMAKLTEEEKMAIIERRMEGKPLGEIAASLGRANSTVYRAIQAAEHDGVVFPPVAPRPGRPGDPVRDERIAEALTSGASIEEAAELEGVSTSTVRRAAQSSTDAPEDVEVERLEMELESLQEENARLLREENARLRRERDEARAETVTVRECLDLARRAWLAAREVVSVAEDVRNAERDLEEARHRMSSAQEDLALIERRIAGMLFAPREERASS